MQNIQLRPVQQNHEKLRELYIWRD